MDFVSAHTGMEMYGGYHGMTWFDWLITPLVVAVLVLLIVYLVKKIQDKK